MVRCISSVCLPCIPTFLSARNKATSLGERVCINWRVIPPLAALAICVLGIAMSILYDQTLFSMIYSVGALASLYMLYLAHQYSYLKSFSENNTKLSRSIRKTEEINKSLQIENNKYKELNDTLSNKVDDLKKTSERFQVQVTRAEEENTRLQQSNQQLETSVTLFKQENDTLGRSIQQLESASQKELERIESIRKSIVQVQEKASGSQEEFSQALSILAANLETLTGENKNLKESTDEVNKSVELLKKTNSTLSDIFEAIKKEAVQERYQQLISVNNLLQSVALDLGKKQKELEVLNQQTESLGKKVESLKNVKEQFKEELQKFSSQAGQIHQGQTKENQKLSELLAKMEKLLTNENILGK